MRAEAIPTVDTRLRIGDSLGHWRVRWAIGRGSYRVSPGLYQVGTPDTASPVLVTANYKLTFDVLRSELRDIDAWLLVLDTQGVNVWCAAGKGTFGTDELARSVQACDLPAIVSHRTLILPQLGATGVAAHEVRRLCGFRVIYGPVRASDIKEFLEAGLRATDDMRRVTFTLRERLALVGGELAPLAKWFVLVVLAAVVLDFEDPMLHRLAVIGRHGTPVLVGALAGTVLVPIFLPWIPGRAFSLKGAVIGFVVVGATTFVLPGVPTAMGKVQALLLGTAAASFLAMQFTGATTFTCPSGVEWEMRRALPLHVGALVLALAITVGRWVAG